MITFIKGTVYSYTAESVIIENHGIGYFINFMHPEVLSLGEQITIFTFQHFREDATVLYGFKDQKEQELFNNLISVKGLGPKTALVMLGFSSTEKIIEAIENGDIAYLKKMPGVGSKTAQQIILDLKGKLVEADNNDTNKDQPALKDAVNGLKALGYKTSEINLIMADLRKLDSNNSDELLKQGLKLLLKRKGL